MGSDEVQTLKRPPFEEHSQMCEPATLCGFSSVLNIFWLNGNAWFCELLDKGCSKDKFRSEIRSYSISFNELQIKWLTYCIFLTVYGSSEAEGMLKDLASPWEHFNDFTSFIAEAQQRFWGYSLGCNFIKQETNRQYKRLYKIQ